MEKLKVELLHEHENAGLLFPAGAILELDPDTAQRLIEAQRARPAGLPTRKPNRNQED